MSAQQRPQLRSLWHVRATAGEPASVIRVRNLQAVAQIGADAWGRKSKVQPMLISVEASLREPFTMSSTEDNVSADTIHYGQLSKAVLASVEWANVVASTSSDDTHISLWELLQRIWLGLTGREVGQGPMPVPVEGGRKPFLDLERVRFLCVEVRLPKATLVGERVSLTGMTAFGPESGGGGSSWVYGIGFGLKGLRVPTLIGVNANEREGKQVVVADLEIENYNMVDDVHFMFEETVHEEMAKSSFATLEALASCVFQKIKDRFARSNKEWRVRIRLEKPVAVPLAEGAVVEFTSPVSAS